MAIFADEERLLCLHTGADGRVWHSNNSGIAIPTGRTAAELRQCEFAADLGKTESIRLLGCARNADLIVALHEQRLQYPATPTSRVVLYSPVGLPGLEVWNVARVLGFLRGNDYPAQLAFRRHNLTRQDYVTYSLIVAGQRQQSPSLLMRLLAYHPLQAVIAFVPNPDHAAFARLITDIVDPCWFVHPTRPNRSTRLHAYLGVHPEGVTRMLAGDSSFRYSRRLANAVLAWSGRAKSEFRPDSLNYFDRIVAEADTLSAGVTAATKCFLRLVLLVWLDAVKPRRHPDDTGFDPRHFFRDSESAQRYQACVAAIKVPQ